MRLYIVVEGQTEEAVVKEVLAPHLISKQVYALPIIVKTSAGHKGGGRNWHKWRNDIQKVLRQEKGRKFRVTTLFDLYGLPHNFPGMKEHGEVQDTVRRCERLEQAMANALSDDRFIPYLQRHELEALVLASIKELGNTVDDVEGVKRLAAEVAGQAPEDINDGPMTAPSKRLQEHIVGYDKVTIAALVIDETGLPEVRRQCPRFDAWLSVLESLGGQEDE